ncbi:uncharacterized protein [Anoplolepis gracilipes]|uniref:uncharacterized protein isoform X1 n=1 Tax=Anoplolepis gracilipes TaxID=354296 RepID=UPI003BA26AB1
MKKIGRRVGVFAFRFGLFSWYLTVMQFRSLTIYWLFILLSTGFVYADISNWDACSGRLERALDALQRDSTRKNKLDEEKAGTLYQRELRSVPLEMSVSRMTIKLLENTKKPGSHWARVEQCVYEPDSSSLKTRVVFNDLSVSALVSLMPRDYHAPIPAESCRMTLRLRRAGIDFHTSPIARGRGQMRIRTESSFLEPRFASIYAYGCHPTRLNKQIKRQDKWPPYHSGSDKVTPTLSPVNEKYDAAEPRKLAEITEETDVVISNDSRYPRIYSHALETNFGIWKKNSWITKSPLRQRRSTETVNKHEQTEKFVNFTKIFNLTDSIENKDSSQNISREVREFVADDHFDNPFSINSEDPNRNWQSKEYITREMEDVFLQGASQVLTRYIENQLHPAIKETLMLSMGYTISYG